MRTRRTRLGSTTPSGFAAAVLTGRRRDLCRRAAAGLVRDGHGDLRAEHVVLEHGIEIVDCVEFDPRAAGDRRRPRPGVSGDGPGCAATSGLHAALVRPTAGGRRSGDDRWWRSSPR